MIRDERGLTSTISYTLTIVIATVLVTGLIVAAGGEVDSQRSDTVEAQMDVVGQQVAGNLEAADRLVRSTDGDPDSLTLYRDLPDQLLGAEYDVGINDTGVVVRSQLSDQTVAVVHVSATDVEESTIQGGSIVIEYDDTADELEVAND